MVRDVFVPKTYRSDEGESGSRGQMSLFEIRIPRLPIYSIEKLGLGVILEQYLYIDLAIQTTHIDLESFIHFIVLLCRLRFSFLLLPV